MQRKLWAVVAIILMGIGMLAFAGFWYYTGTNAFMQAAGETAAAKGSELLGTRLEIGRVRVDSLHQLTIENIVLYDKQDACIAEAESAKVRFSLFAVLGNKPASGIEEVAVHQVKADLQQRPDGRWNYEDFTQKNSQSNDFRGIVRVQDGMLTGRAAGKSLQLENVQALFDFADPAAVRTDVQATRQGAEISASGKIGDESRLSLEGKNLDVTDYLDFLPAGMLPASVEISAGRVDRVSAVLQQKNGQFTYSGQAEVSQGTVRLWDTEVKKIAGLVTFSDKEVSVFASGEAAGQRMAVHGKILLDAAEPYMNLVLESAAFDPGAVLRDTPFHGAVAFTVNVYGTFSNPGFEGDFQAANGTVYGYSFANARGRAAYQDGRLVIRRLAADVFGGKAEVSGEFDTAAAAYDGRVKLSGIDAAQLSDFLPAVTGNLSADLGIAGQGKDLKGFSVYGSFSVKGGSYRGIAVPSMEASFSRTGQATTIDYLSIGLTSGSLGVEGTVQDNTRLDLTFSGTHVDLGLFKYFVPEADVSGVTDCRGQVKGDLTNPVLQIDFSAVDGKLFEQPYRTLQGSASGSLDGVRIDSFSLKNGGRETWKVQGTVGFTGKRRVQLQIDTMGARMEDIAALVAPEQPITGNVDNIITITGTLDNPSMVGYIHFYQGSYHGYLLSGMDGDYNMANGVMTLHDFHIFSPLVDMDLNGTVTRSGGLDLRVAAHDLDLNRFDHILPYPISGHGKFDGQINGSLEAPSFDGLLTAGKLSLNGQILTQAHGKVRLRGHRVFFDSFGVEQKDGSYSLTASLNTVSRSMDGHLEVKNGDINALLAIFNLKNDIIHGQMNGTLGLGGTVDRPRVHLTGFAAKGELEGYALSDVYVDANLVGRVITLNRFDGKQGEGVFAAEGTVDMEGPMDARLSVKNAQAGILARLAGLDTPAKGSVDLEAQLSGSVSDPAADVSLTINGGGIGASTFDSLAGLFNLRDGVIQVNQLIVRKMQAGHSYKASAYGSIPIKAIGGDVDNLHSDEQMNLRLSLDQADLSLLPFLSNSVDWAMGETYGNLMVSGTLAQPMVRGTLGFKNGALKFKELTLPFTDMQADIAFEGNRILINEFSGKLGNGSYRLIGNSQFSGRMPVGYDFMLTADQLDIGSSFYKGPLSGTLRLNEGEIYGRRMPQLSGNILVDNATVSIPTIPDSKGDMPRLLLDLDLKLGKKVHFYSPFLYDMRIAGAAHFGGTTRHPRPSGTISVLRGTVNYLKTSFTVREGEAYFNQVDSFLPSIVLHADTKLTKAKVYLSVEGPVEQMAVHLTSSPEMSETEILQLLTLRSEYRSGQQGEFNSFLDVGLQMSVLSEAEGAVRDWLNLDLFNIARDTSQNTQKTADNSAREVYNVEMGKYISDKVMMRYVQGIGGSQTRRYGVQYDFNDRMSFTVEHDQDNAYRFGLEARFNF
jgi:translocation and assembly module TamB